MSFIYIFKKVKDCLYHDMQNKYGGPFKSLWFRLSLCMLCQIELFDRIDSFVLDANVKENNADFNKL